MCNQAGDGVEIAAFLDQDCTLYTNQVAYGNMLTGTEYKYWYNSRTHIEYMFNVGYSCYDPYTKYINPYDEQQGNYGNNYQANNNGEYYYPQAAEYCTNVFQGSNMGVMAVKTCSDYSGNNNGRRVEEDFEQVYTLAEDDVNNGYAVCSALTGMGGSGEHLYEKSASGSMYKYTGGAKTSAAWEQQKNKKSHGGLIAFFVIFLLSVGVGIAYYFYNKKQKESQQEKKEPLVDMTGPADENASAFA
jgi:cbb3-type cytochrome oxidase subunit 3